MCSPPMIFETNLSDDEIKENVEYLKKHYHDGDYRPTIMIDPFEDRVDSQFRQVYRDIERIASYVGVPLERA